MQWSTVFMLRMQPARAFFSALLRTLPFSLSIVSVILVTTAITNTLAHPISPTGLSSWGFGIGQPGLGRFYRLFTATFQILRPYMAITITATILLFVGACEYRLGTAKAAIAFWAGHVVGYIGGGLVLALLARMGSSWAMEASGALDVGASNGAFGAAGAVVLFLGRRARRTAFLLLSVYLVTTLLVERKNWDVEHILAFSAGLVVGGVYLRRMGRSWPGLLPSWQIEKRQRPLVVSWALVITGVVNVLGAFLLPNHAGFARLEAWLPIGGPHWPRHLLLVTGLILLTLAPGLARRQRVAWWGALCALGLSLLVHLQVGIGRIENALGVTFLFLLVAWRRDFRAPANAPSLRSGLALLASLVIAVPLYGLIGFFILRTRFDPTPTVTGAFLETVSRVFFVTPGNAVAVDRPAQWFLGSIPLFAWFGVVLAVSRVVRSSLAPGVVPTDLDVARRLLRRYGDSGTSYMTLWERNSLFLSPAHECYVAYRVNSGVAVALGDPIGAPVGRAATIHDFTRHADDHGWTPVFYAATSALLQDYKECGYDPLQIGEEAVVSLPRMAFQGKQWQNIRTACNRAERSGVKFRMFEGGVIPQELRSQLSEISAEWSAHQELPPMGFTLGAVADVDDPNVNVAMAVDATGRVHAFVDWLPVYGRRGWVIDLMRRRADAMPGVMDFLIGTSMMVFKERGYESASLATAPLAGLDRIDDATPLQWLLSKVYERSWAYYDFRSLYRYKEKFQPQWERIYLLHRGLVALPAVAAALARAYLPGLGLAEATKLLGESAARKLFPKQKLRPDGPRTIE